MTPKYSFSHVFYADTAADAGAILDHALRSGAYDLASEYLPRENVWRAVYKTDDRNTDRKEPDDTDVLQSL